VTFKILSLVARCSGYGTFRNSLSALEFHKVVWGRVWSVVGSSVTLYCKLLLSVTMN